jgi:hypothetical protein
VLFTGFNGSRAILPDSWAHIRGRKARLPDIFRGDCVRKRLNQADATYARLLAQYAKTPFESNDVELKLQRLAEEDSIVELETKSQRRVYVRRSNCDAGVKYGVFGSETAAVVGKDAIGACEITKVADGICCIRDAEVSRAEQRTGIATAVYDLITSDMVKVGGLLWPVAPGKMTDAEFKVWWRRSPALVFYYPHRNRLGLSPRTEFEELFDITVRSGLWDRTLAYADGLISRVRRSAYSCGRRR